MLAPRTPPISGRRRGVLQRLAVRPRLRVPPPAQRELPIALPGSVPRGVEAVEPPGSC